MTFSVLPVADCRSDKEADGPVMFSYIPRTTTRGLSTAPNPIRGGESTSMQACQSAVLATSHTDIFESASRVCAGESPIAAPGFPKSGALSSALATFVFSWVLGRNALMQMATVSGIASAMPSTQRSEDFQLS